MLEVQQSCDLTYRLYDWGRPREVHIEKGLEVIKEDKLLPVSQFTESFECEYFSLEKISVKGGYSFLVPAKSALAKDWQLIFVLDGSGTVKNSDSQKFELAKEDLIAVKPGEKITIEGTLVIMKILCR